MSSESTGTADLAGRYATALFELAEADGQLDQVAADVTQLRTMIDDSEDLRRLIHSPMIARRDQGKAMAALLGKAGVSDLVCRLVGLAAQNRRLFILRNIIDSYLAKLAARRGETTAHVVSAQDLSDQQQRDLETALKQAVGNRVAIDARVDPTLLGGMVVKVGSRMVDSSLKTKLQQLKLAMMGVG